MLVADDNVVNQKIAVMMLERLGHRVDVATNGAEAVDAITAMGYSVVLMDCHMPVMDGFEASREVRDRLGQRKLPIIAMTASVTSEDRQRCREAGMNDVLAKPVTLQELDQVLDRWVGDGSA